MLSEQDHRRVSDAITKAEQGTSAEIYCVLDSEASRYREVPLAWASVAALLVPAMALLFGPWPVEIAALFGGWTMGEVGTGATLTTYILTQALLFVLTATLLSVPVLRRAATPAFMKRHRAHQVAERLLISTGVHLPQPKCHVLIYVALDDHQIEILAEEAVERALGATLLAEAAAAFTSAMRVGDPVSGYVRAIEIVAVPLAQHFPPRAGEGDALPNTILEM